MKNKKILKTIILILILICSLFHSNFVFATDKPNLTSESAFLIDTNTHKVLYSKNENKKMYPASTTKVLTAILALENANLTDVATASYNAVMTIPNGYSVANIQIGEELTIEQLLQLLLIPSANDAANVIAESVGGSIDSFVSMMNTKVNELELTNSHFTNPYGKHDENHYTTSHDLAILMEYCLANNSFRKIAGSASCAIPATNKYTPRSYTSTNELIIPNNSNYYNLLTTGKTGYTSQAKGCLVSSAYKDDLELICVVMGGNTASDNQQIRFEESKALYEYGYSNYSIKSIIEKGDILNSVEVENGTKDTKHLDLIADNSINALININELNSNFTPTFKLVENISAPIEQDTILGTVTYNIDDSEYSCNLLAATSVNESKFINYALQIGALLLVLIIVFELIFSKRNKRR